MSPAPADRFSLARAARFWNTLLFLALGSSLVLGPGSVSAQCIEYGDHLHWLGNANTPDRAFCVALSGEYAYVADYAAGLQVVRVSEDAAPEIVGKRDTPGLACGVAVAGDHAYLADGARGFLVLRVAIPKSPAIVGTVDTHFARDVAVQGNYAYVADDQE